MDESLQRRLIEAQRDEITEHHVYLRLAELEPDDANQQILRGIAEDEKRHYEFWAKHTGHRPRPRRGMLRRLTWMARLLGITFTVRLMERAEDWAQANYGDVARELPEAAEIMRDEQEHERKLLDTYDEESLRYVGSVVLGLNDALVELTGALAGFTLALRETRLIAMIGLITGLAAAMSMAASEYLSTKADKNNHHKAPAKAAVYTGVAYVLTVLLLIVPFLVLSSAIAAMGVTLAMVLLVILAFSFYTAVAQDLPFVSRFLEMAGLSLGVATVSFGIGYLLRAVLGVEA